MPGEGEAVDKKGGDEDSKQGRAFQNAKNINWSPLVFPTLWWENKELVVSKSVTVREKVFEKNLPMDRLPKKCQYIASTVDPSLTSRYLN